MWNLSSLTRDWTCVPCIARQILNHWTTQKSLKLILTYIMRQGPTSFFYMQIFSHPGPTQQTPTYSCCCSVAQSCLTLCNSMDCCIPGFPVHHQLPELAQTQVHWVGDAIQPICLLLSLSPAFNVFQHQCIFRWVSSSHQVAKVLELQLQHQSLQWIFRTVFL